MVNSDQLFIKLEGWRRGIDGWVAAMGRIGPRRNRREVAGPAAGPMGPMADRTQNLQPAAIFHFLLMSVRLVIGKR